MRQDSDVIKRRCHHVGDTTNRQKARSAEAATCGTGSHANLETQDFPTYIDKFDRLNLILVLWTLIMISNDDIKFAIGSLLLLLSFICMHVFVL